jgi:hypothetical protein
MPPKEVLLQAEAMPQEAHLPWIPWLNARQPIRRRGKLAALSLAELSSACANSTFKDEIAKNVLLLHKCLHLLKFINHV